MKRIVHKSYSFKEAQRWDIEQQVNMSHEQRQKAAKALRYRVFGRNAKGMQRRLRGR